MEYSETDRDHALKPRNVGFIEGFDGRGESGDPHCGDVVVMTIRVRDGRLVDVRFLVQGCGAAIATCSMAKKWRSERPLSEQPS